MCNPKLLNPNIEWSLKIPLSVSKTKTRLLSNKKGVMFNINKQNMNDKINLSVNEILYLFNMKLKIGYNMIPIDIVII